MIPVIRPKRAAHLVPPKRPGWRQTELTATDGSSSPRQEFHCDVRVKWEKQWHASEDSQWGFYGCSRIPRVGGEWGSEEVRRGSARSYFMERGTVFSTVPSPWILVCTPWKLYSTWSSIILYKTMVSWAMPVVSAPWWTYKHHLSGTTREAQTMIEDLLAKVERVLHFNLSEWMGAVGARRHSKTLSGKPDQELIQHTSLRKGCNPRSLTTVMVIVPINLPP